MERTKDENGIIDPTTGIFITHDEENDICAMHVDEEVGLLILDARTEAAMTQSELARLIGSTQSVISRLEDSEYEGHTVGMLRRIAKALGKTLVIRLEPEPVVKREPMPFDPY